MTGSVFNNLIMKKILIAMSVIAAMSAVVSCACRGNQERTVEESSLPETQCDTPVCAACDSTYYCEE